ncbi:MAG: DUF3306 domain-containing protein [Undibacterium sp.]|nr:DUF3306 domain-containing protein [Undibacterium sp.]
MAAEDFFNRWSKRKESLAVQVPAEAIEVTAEISQPISTTLPGAEDVAQLHDESDFSLYMKQGVDESVRRSAMKKLFSNPHFNVMDGLDIYVADYSQADPLPPGMLASLRHAQTLLNPLQHLENASQRLLDTHSIVATDDKLAPKLEVDAHEIKMEEPVIVIEDQKTEADTPDDIVKLDASNDNDNHKDQT